MELSSQVRLPDVDIMMTTADRCPKTNCEGDCPPLVRPSAAVQAQPAFGRCLQSAADLCRAQSYLRPRRPTRAGALQCQTSLSRAGRNLDYRTGAPWCEFLHSGIHTLYVAVLIYTWPGVGCSCLCRHLMQEPADRLSWAQKAGNLFFRGALTSKTREILAQDDAFMQSRLTDVGIGDWLRDGIRFESLPAHCTHRHPFFTSANQNLHLCKPCQLAGLSPQLLLNVLLVRMQSILCM